MTPSRTAFERDLAIFKRTARDLLTADFTPDQADEHWHQALGLGWTISTEIDAGSITTTLVGHGRRLCVWSTDDGRAGVQDLAGRPRWYSYPRKVVNVVRDYLARLWRVTVARRPRRVPTGPRPRSRRRGTPRSTRAGPSGDDDPEPEQPDPFELTWLDRVPLWWRLGRLRCYWFERREGLR